MKDFLKIENIKAMEILDSRGNPTVQVEVVTEGGFTGVAMVPSGASTGSFEAVELRDDSKERYLGKGVLQAVQNVNKKIAREIEGMNVYEQVKIDKKLIDKYINEFLSLENLVRELIINLVEKIYIYQDKQVDIIFTFKNVT